MYPMLLCATAAGCIAAMGGVAGALLHPEFTAAYLGVATAGFGIATPSAAALTAKWVRNQ